MSSRASGWNKNRRSQRLIYITVLLTFLVPFLVFCKHSRQHTVEREIHQSVTAKKKDFLTICISLQTADTSEFCGLLHEHFMTIHRLTSINHARRLFCVCIQWMWKLWKDFRVSEVDLWTAIDGRTESSWSEV